jgi:hypothetical protein
MKRKDKSLTMDEAVEKLAAIMEPVWSRMSTEEKQERLRNFGKVISSLKKKRHAKPSRSARVRPDRRRALARG